MLLVVAGIVLIAGTIWMIADDYDHCLPFITVVASTFASVVMLIVLANNYIGVNARVAADKTRYEMLKYQYENNFYNNENEVGKYQLISDIRAWNEDLSKYKTLQHDFWVGIFIPDVYDQFEYINIKE